MCICVYVSACNCVQRDADKHATSWQVVVQAGPASVNTERAAQIEMERNEDLCDCFHPDGGYNDFGVGPGRFPQ